MRNTRKHDTQNTRGLARVPWLITTQITQALRVFGRELNHANPRPRYRRWPLKTTLCHSVVLVVRLLLVVVAAPPSLRKEGPRHRRSSRRSPSGRRWPSSSPVVIVVVLVLVLAVVLLVVVVLVVLVSDICIHNNNINRVAPSILFRGGWEGARWEERRTPPERILMRRRAKRNPDDAPSSPSESPPEVVRVAAHGGLLKNWSCNATNSCLAAKFSFGWSLSPTTRWAPSCASG